MKQDLNQLMLDQNAACLWISGAAQHNPAMVYMTGGAHLTGADLFVLPGQTPWLCHGPMERDEAAKSGFQLLSYANYPIREYLQRANGDHLEAAATRYQQILQDVGVTEGEVVLYGYREFGPFFSMVKRLGELLPKVNFKGDMRDALLLEARATKSPEETERIRQMGRVTTEVVGRTRDLLANSRVAGETLLRADGEVLTIGDVKRQINLWLSELGAENPEDTIFAIGHDAGVPHSGGTPSDPIKLGQTIVYDIFPCEAGGGYFYDFTRTWCVGYATDEVHQAFEQVRLVYDTMAQELELGANPARYQARTCELFEGMGHETVRQNPRVQQGYVHSLGHGVGLDVHEKPWFSSPEDDSNCLRPGSVFTLEPGLYYPEKGWGIRLEDTWYVTPDGNFKKFVDFPMDLIIPLKG